VFTCVFQVSGARFWKLLQQLCVTPEKFFRRCFVHNLCPLLFLSQNAKNVTPPDLPVDVRTQLNTACDRALVEIVRLLCIQRVVAIGKYSECRARDALKDSAVNISVLMHPSPANPAANKGWNERAVAQLTQAGLMQYLQ